MSMSYKNEKMHLYFIYSKMHVSFMENIGRPCEETPFHLSICFRSKL